MKTLKLKPARRCSLENRFDGLTPGNLTDGEKAAVQALALEVMVTEHRPGTDLNNSVKVRKYLRMLMGAESNEKFMVIFLDNQVRLLAHEILFTGTIDGAAIYPRVVVSRALDHNAASVIFAHNHPSGVAEPSQSDVAVTLKLKAALQTVDIRVLDHLVVSTGEVTSMAERNML